MANGKHDTGLFLAFVGVFAVPLVYLLQANGVVVIRWLPSLILYSLIIAAFIWAYCRWSSPHTWPKIARFLVLAVLIILLGALSSIGVLNQYEHDNPPQVLAVAFPAQPSPPANWYVPPLSRTPRKKSATKEATVAAKGGVIINGNATQTTNGDCSPAIIGNGNTNNCAPPPPKVNYRATQIPNGEIPKLRVAISADARLVEPTFILIFDKPFLNFECGLSNGQNIFIRRGENSQRTGLRITLGAPPLPPNTEFWIDVISSEQLKVYSFTYQ